MVRGIGVSPGVAYARATLVRTNFPEVPDRTVRPEQVEETMLKKKKLQLKDRMQEIARRQRGDSAHP